MFIESLKRALKDAVGLQKAEDQVDEAIKQQERMAGDFRDMRQRLESLKRIVAELKHKDDNDVL